MQSLRNTIRQFPQQLKRANKQTRPYTPMSLFPRFTQEFSPLFRLLDDYDRHTFRHLNQTSQSLRSFSPKFDVKELKDMYELHGELPGIEQKDINIEWSDGNTLTISGRTETIREEGQHPQGFIEGVAEPESKKLEGGDNHYHKPTVENEATSSAETATKQAEQQITKTNQNQSVTKPNEHEPKFWVSERSIGEFHRSFSFPAHVDQDAVKASLKNGILSIIVPKAKAPQPRKINIE